MTHDQHIFDMILDANEQEVRPLLEHYRDEHRGTIYSDPPLCRVCGWDQSASVFSHSNFSILYLERIFRRGAKMDELVDVLNHSVKVRDDNSL